jgi:hypothetical protein
VKMTQPGQITEKDHLGDTEGRPVIYAWRVTYTDGPVQSFFYRVAYLLEDFGASIRRCKQCSTFFLAQRSDQLFCKVRCQNRDAQNRLRAKRQSAELRKRGRPPKVTTEPSTIQPQNKKGGQHGTKGR